MLSALSHFFGNVSTWLTILKYLGLTLAAGSSIWGTVNVLTTTKADGHVKLTIAGRTSIALTILGLIISIVSEELAQRDAADAQAAQIQNEANRTNSIIVAGQPLTSLRLTWTFVELDDALNQLLKKGNDDAMAFLNDQQRERGAQENGALFREDQLYPFLVSLSRILADDNAKEGNANVVVLFPLDDDANSVLPFGFLDSAKPWLNHQPDASNNRVNPSIEIGSHIERGNSDLQNWPELGQNGSSVIVKWRLDPATFAKSFDRQNGFVAPTAKPPGTLRVAILFDINGLPFAENNFALAENSDFWKSPKRPDVNQKDFRGLIPSKNGGFSSSVQLIPNGSDLVNYSYVLKEIYETQFQDEYGEAYGDSRCLIFEYEQSSSATK